jgi:hypothetical protein
MSDERKFDLTLLKQIAVVLIIVGAAGTYPLQQYASEQVTQGVMAGVGLSVVNILMGFVVIQFSLNRSYTTFIQIVLGGIALRLFVMVALLLLFVGLLKFHSISLVGSLFVMYVIFLTLEVIYIHKKIQNS